MFWVGVAVKRAMYQRKVDVDMLNAVKSVLADVLSVGPLSEQKVLHGLAQLGFIVKTFSRPPCHNVKMLYKILTL